VLIIIDTVAAAAAFKKEDDAAQAQYVMNALGKLSSATGAFVLGVDHFGKDVETGTRGSSAKEGSAENILALLGKREITGRVTDLRMGVRKVKDADQGRIIPFRLEVINCGTDEDGDQITTCVINWELDRPVTQSQTGRPRSAHAAFMSALAEALRSSGEDISPSDDDTVVRAVKVAAVRAAFGRLAMAADQGDLTDAAIKMRWQRAYRAACNAGLVKAQTHNGADYLWEPEHPL
jgi:hypothetical protein